MNCEFRKKLLLPIELKQLYPLSEKAAEAREERNRRIADVFEGRSDSFLLIIGPCSADYEDSVMDYVHRLAEIQEKVGDRIIIIPRIYTNKPRSTGEGYKGMVHQPNPLHDEDVYGGIVKMRNIHIRVIEETGMVCADEMLYPESYRYVSDLLGYVAVGARSVENQHHRLTASAIDVPVGMKNPMSGDYSAMLNAVNAAQQGHTFIYRGWEVVSRGNPLTHAILRGSMDVNGINHPNYSLEELEKVNQMYLERGLKNPAVIVDTNHSNSNKNYLEQINISRSVMESRRKSPEAEKLVKGLMIESYIEDGNQRPEEGVYGRSITDPCMGWEKTEKLILKLGEI